MTIPSGWEFDVAAATLLLGFGFAAIADWRHREVTDRLWPPLAAIGGVVGAFLVAPGGPVALASWVLVALLALALLLPIDDVLERFHADLPTFVEIGAFVAVGAVLLLLVLRSGIGVGGVSGLALAAYVGILLAYLLFYFQLLKGGADAAALVVASVLLPLQAGTWISLPGSAGRILGLYPFPLTVLMNAALLGLPVPIALAVRNFRRGEFRFPQGFTGFSIPVRELPERFVWLKEPEVEGMDEEADAAGTTAEDQALRVRLRDALERRGVARAWVSPQLPFLVLLLLGTVVALFAGNLIFDLLAVL